MGEWSPTEIIFGGIFGVSLLIGLIACIGGFLHARRKQLQLHEERMKALELGRELPDDLATARIKASLQIETAEAETPVSPGKPMSLAVQCYSTTGWVAGLGLLFAAGGGGSDGVRIAVASAAGAVGITGMICGTVLAAKVREPEPSPSILTKPRFDPEGV